MVPFPRAPAAGCKGTGPGLPSPCRGASHLAPTGWGGAEPGTAWVCCGGEAARLRDPPPFFFLGSAAVRPAPYRHSPAHTMSGGTAPVGRPHAQARGTGAPGGPARYRGVCGLRPPRGPEERRLPMPAERRNGQKRKPFRTPARRSPRPHCHVPLGGGWGGGAQQATREGRVVHTHTHTHTHAHTQAHGPVPHTHTHRVPHARAGGQAETIGKLPLSCGAIWYQERTAQACGEGALLFYSLKMGIECRNVI